MRRGGRRIEIAVAAAIAVLVVVASLPGSGHAKKRKVTVRPGNNAISKALQRVKEPGVVRVKRGRYRESVTIDKQVKLKAVGRGRRPVIDGECEAELTVAVRHDDVRVRGLKVIGAGSGTFPIEVDFRGVSGGGVKDLVMRDTCDAEYGINLFETGPIDVLDSKAVGFSDAGFYAGEITATPGGAIRVRGNEAYHNTRGVIVENSAGGDVRVVDNVFNFNDVPGFAGAGGVVIHNSDDVLIEGNEARRNLDFGLHLTPGSDDNAVLANTFLGNPVDIRNEGSGNCGAENVFETGVSLPPC